MAVPSSAGRTSSPRWATATATTAASPTPTSPRSASSTQNAGAAAARTVARQAPSRPLCITAGRPTVSASDDSGRIARASAPVAADTVRRAAVGPPRKDAPIAGSSACVEYSSPNAARAANSIATLSRRSSRLPAARPSAARWLVIAPNATSRDSPDSTRCGGPDVPAPRVRDPNGEVRAADRIREKAAVAVDQAHTSLVPFRDGPGDREPQPAACPRRAAAVAGVEPVEDPVPLRLGDARAVVDNVEPGAGAVLDQRHPDQGARMAYGVLEQVADQPAELVGVPEDGSGRHRRGVDDRGGPRP